MAFTTLHSISIAASCYFQCLTRECPFQPFIFINVNIHNYEIRFPIAIAMQVPINSWVDWSNMSKVPCSREQQQQQCVYTQHKHLINQLAIV